MASASVSIGNLDQLLRIRDINLGQEFQGAMDTAMERGEEAMKEAVATRGTGKTWSRPWGRNGRTGSHPGRIDSGDMQAEVRGIITESSDNHVEGNLGWDENSEAYIAYQDQGFEHVITGDYIEGMSALRDGAELARNVLLEEVDNIVKRF